MVLTLRRPGVEGSYGGYQYVSVNLVSSTHCWNFEKIWSYNKIVFTFG